MFSVYILKSLRKEWYYIGQTSNKDIRLEYHNGGKVRSTKPYAPFAIIYYEEFVTRSEAFKREQQIKKYRHGEAFKKLIGV
jgi:putative endonuclease